MKPTAKEHGLKTDWFIDERSDPEKATIAAAKYLKTLSKMFDGDWNLVLAAYNGGPGRVSRAIKRAGVEDFWKLSATTKYLPRETREYVPLIMAAMIIGRNPAQYGFEAVTAEPLAYDKVTLPRAIDLRRVAEWAGTDGGRNPGAQPGAATLDDAGEVSGLRSQGAEGHRRRADRAAGGRVPGRFQRAQVVHGEEGRNALTVARRFGVSRADVAEANNLSARRACAPGRI